jgi:hypothetical protein
MNGNSRCGGMLIRGRVSPAPCRDSLETGFWERSVESDVGLRLADRFRGVLLAAHKAAKTINHPIALVSFFYKYTDYQEATTTQAVAPTPNYGSADGSRVAVCVTPSPQRRQVP